MPLLAGVLLASVPVAASDHDKGAPDAVRRAVEAGEIKSLADILASVRGKLPGEVAGVEIERERGRWLYEFRLVDDKGRLYEAYVDARSGEIEHIKEK
ncbi:PepSY domain-containing protein [Bradyrhizobium japonicum]|uniref:PepSY domain-containing protein n=1 Tax=Bradyrhizobium japonicum TaxID=375 RepID=UPI000428E1C5